MNVVFLVLVLGAVVTAAAGGTMEAVSAATLAASEKAVSLALSMIGYFALFLGLVRLAQDAGLMTLLARAIRPLMVRLFPGVPADHPAMGAMVLNMAANMLGLGNAATPLGIKAMEHLATLGGTPGVATNAMCMFLAINTSGLRLLPLDVVAVRAAEGSKDPWGIVAPTLVATGLATIVAVLAARVLARRGVGGHAVPAPAAADPPPEGELLAEPSPRAVRLTATGLALFVLVLVGPALGAAFAPAGSAWGAELRTLASTASAWVVPVLFALVLVAAWRRGVPVYGSFVEGAKEGFHTAIRILPYLVAILVAIGMLRASGALEALTSTLGLATEPLGLPGEALPLALVRPLSGSGAFGVMTDLVQTHGPDTYLGYLSSVLVGSTETTFYVLALYFGAVSVTRARHAVAAGLAADLAGVCGAVLVCQALFGHLAG